MHLKAGKAQAARLGYRLSMDGDYFPMVKLCAGIARCPRETASGPVGGGCARDAGAGGRGRPPPHAALGLIDETIQPMDVSKNKMNFVIALASYKLRVAANRGRCRRVHTQGAGFKIGACATSRKGLVSRKPLFIDNASPSTPYRKMRCVFLFTSKLGWGAVPCRLLARAAAATRAALIRHADGSDAALKSISFFFTTRANVTAPEPRPRAATDLSLLVCVPAGARLTCGT
ncbi:hypothetical protein EVAR_61193_1 [Eumeta japonica]|uniref:Uncharacterized protein n=1 Tax=Eumeta variegata TaxID=151549 RepID=A0A4C1YXM7_EUMVA|nr:hypothetical protein EVAR_61193_1 [Eumeta japonica]